MCVKIQSMSLFLDIAKGADFQCKNHDVNKTQGMYYVIYIFLDLFYASYNCAKFHHCKTYAIDFTECGGPSSFLSSLEKAYPE